MCSASSDPDEAIPGSPGLSSTAVDHVDGSAAGPMCTAVEAMLREVGEDPDREVRLKYQSSSRDLFLDVRTISLKI